VYTRQIEPGMWEYEREDERERRAERAGRMERMNKGMRKEGTSEREMKGESGRGETDGAR